jgi:hypothetical protein
VVELMLQMRPELAFDPRFSRPLLRESVAGLLPEEVRLRASKSSFDAVFHAALAGPDLPVLRRVVGAENARIGQYVDLDAVRSQLLDPSPPGDRGARQRWAVSVWRLLTAECWLRAQEDAAFLTGLAEREGLDPVNCDLITV